MASLEPLVLIADDEPEITEVLEAYCRRDGLRTVVATDGRAALDLWRKHRPAIAVLDLRMPHMDGLQALAEIRRVSDMPVLFVTALGEDLDKLVGLRVGADDYVVKPASPAEIVARIRAILRRAGSRSAAAEEPLELDGLVIDPGAREARWRDTPLRLTQTEYRLLAHMARRPRWVFERAELMETCTPQSQAFDRVIDSHISSLRRKLKECGASVSVTAVRGSGYRLEVN